MRLAIIGGGGAGLTTAWLLEDAHEVTLYEKEARLGGHADTLTVEVAGEAVALDGGFEFFSEPMFPTFLRLLRALSVPLSPFPMLVTQFHTRTGDLYMLPPLRGGRLYLASLSPRKIGDMLRLRRILSDADEIMNRRDTSVTAEQFLNDVGLSDAFKERFMYPFLQAGWGVTRDDIRSFIIYDILRYSYLNRPTGIMPRGWYEIDGGTQTYINAIASDLQRATIKRRSEITAIARSGDQYRITTQDGANDVYDHVIFATNAHQAAQILQQLPGTDVICHQLNRIEYFETTIAIHSDTRLMPPQRRHWSTVNIRHDERYSQLSMWKPWKSTAPVFKSWVTHDDTLPAHLHATATYFHPKVNAAYFAAQSALQAYQGQENIWLAGMYMHDIDCHESAVISGINVARQLAPNSARLRRLI